MFSHQELAAENRQLWDELASSEAAVGLQVHLEEDLEGLQVQIHGKVGLTPVWAQQIAQLNLALVSMFALVISVDPHRLRTHRCTPRG
jgi:hypothetical protein